MSDVPPIIVSFGGFVTNATHFNFGAVSTLTLTHASTGFSSYVVLLTPYSPRSNSNENDAFVDSNPRAWVFPSS